MVLYLSYCRIKVVFLWLFLLKCLKQFPFLDLDLSYLNDHFIVSSDLIFFSKLKFCCLDLLEYVVYHSSLVIGAKKVVCCWSSSLLKFCPNDDIWLCQYYFYRILWMSRSSKIAEIYSLDEGNVFNEFAATELAAASSDLFVFLLNVFRNICSNISIYLNWI